MKNKLLPNFALACLILLFASCAIHPVAWQLGKLAPFEGTSKLNEKLTKVSKS
jgi:hypothetical protein